MRRASLICVLFLPVIPNARGQTACAATPELAAVHAVLDEPVPSGGSEAGYRAKQLVVDPVLHRAWLRVVPCGPAGPSRLIALDVPADMLSSAPRETGRSVPLAPAVRKGDALEVVVQTANTCMRLHARAATDALLGGMVTVEIIGEGPESPGPRMQGRLVAANRVEIRSEVAP